MHWGPIYPTIHKIHHHHAAPFGIAAEYAHPVETIFLGLGTMLGPFLFATHLFTVWAWLFLRLFQTVEAHAGYDYPWSPNRFIPFWGGTSLSLSYPSCCSIHATSSRVRACRVVSRPSCHL